MACISYQKYGISDELVLRVKRKLKNPAIKERVKMVLDGITKYDLQDRTKVRRLVNQTAKVLNEKLTEQQLDNMAQFILSQKIDPNNTFHLIKLWSMFH